MTDLTWAVQMRHIRYVLAAADHGSFRKAAASLNVQESAISRRVRDLEAWLGTPLFIRNPAGVQLTPAGHQFVFHGRRTIAEIRSVQSEVSTIGKGQTGKLHIGIFSSLASGFLSGLIQKFRARHRAIHLCYIDGNSTGNVAAALRQQRLDVAFIIAPSRSKGCESQRLWNERLFAALPVGHPLAKRIEIHLGSLTDETFIISDTPPGQEIHDHLIQRFATLGRRPIIRYQDVGRDNLMLLVALGHGIALTSEATTGAYFPGVTYRPVIGETLPFSVMWSPKNTNPALHLLLDLARSMSKITGNPEITSRSAGPRLIAAPSRSHDPSR